MYAMRLRTVRTLASTYAVSFGIGRATGIVLVGLFDADSVGHPDWVVLDVRQYAQVGRSNLYVRHTCHNRVIDAVERGDMGWRHT